MRVSLTGWRETACLSLLAVAVGVVSCYASLGFLWAVDRLHTMLLGVSGDALYIQLGEKTNWYLLVLPVVGIFVVRLIVQFVMPNQQNQGPADVIEAARLKAGNLSIKAGIGSAAATIVSIGSGASVGRYGPAVHLGASLGSWLAQLLKLSAEHKKNLLACGVAGAISASFSAPLAGVVFAHEVVLGRFGSKSLIPIVISSVVATAIAKMYALDNMIFMLPDLPVPVFTNLEYLLFALVGILGGVLAIIYMFMIAGFSDFTQRLPISTLSKSLAGGLLLGVILFIFPQTFGLGEQIIRDALHAELSAGVLIVLIIAKLLATSVSFAAGFSGGVFGPALFLGAMMGTVFGIGVQELTGLDVSPAVYGVVGMGAVVSRVVGAPITTMLIVFEMTGSYLLMTAVMVSVVAGATVTRKLFNRSYFYHQLRARGLEPETSQVQQNLSELPISTLMVEQSFVLKNNMDLAAMCHATMLYEATIREGYVIDSAGKLSGQIDLAVLTDRYDRQAKQKPVDRMLFKPEHIVTKDMSIYQVYEKIQGFKGSSIPVIDGQSQQFLGVVYISELVRACVQAFERYRDLER